MPAISVVIANWNGRHHLADCLPALAEQSLAPTEVIVVDNGSSDGSQEWLAERFPAVRVIANDRNRGFSAANNQGIRAARGDCVALLNNDARPATGWLAALAHALEGDSRRGMAGSLMVFADQPAVINSTGISVDRLGISWDRDGGRPVAVAGEAETEVFGASAGAALYRRALFDDVGVFDESFFAYLEDVDLAWRARWRGWRAVFAPGARVTHAHSATSQEGSGFKTYWLSRNKIVHIAKNYPSPYLWRYMPLMLVYDGLSLANALAGRRGLSALRGRLAGWRALGAVWRQRRALLQAATATPDEVFAWLEPVDWPWRLQQTRYGHMRRRATRPRLG
jgi:GT2 family glycosyltransferase